MKEDGEPAAVARPPASGAGRAGARRYRPLPLREAMYRRVLELRNEGLSYRQIIRKIEEEFGEKLCAGQVSVGVRGIHRPGRRVGHELKLGPDLAWLLRVLAGDGRGVPPRPVRRGGLDL